MEYTDKMRRPLTKQTLFIDPEAYGLDSAESRRFKKAAEELGRRRRNIAKVREELQNKRAKEEQKWQSDQHQ